MTKSFACPGLRLGWLCTRNKSLFEQMSCFKDYLTICPPAPSEVLTLIGLRNKDKLLQHTMNIVQQNLQELEVFFARHRDIFDWFPPRASTIGFLRLKGRLLRMGKGGASTRGILTREQTILLSDAIGLFRALQAQKQCASLDDVSMVFMNHALEFRSCCKLIVVDIYITVHSTRHIC